MQPLAILKQCRCSMFADLIRFRGAALAVAGVGAAQLIGSRLGVGLPCMYHQLSGKPCPGCGLTRSVLALLHGDVGASINLHPFGPVLLLGLVTALVAAVLPDKPRVRFVESIAVFERTTGLAALGFALLMLTWGLRAGGVLHLAQV